MQSHQQLKMKIQCWWKVMMKKKQKTREVLLKHWLRISQILLSILLDSIPKEAMNRRKVKSEVNHQHFQTPLTHHKLGNKKALLSRVNTVQHRLQATLIRDQRHLKTITRSTIIRSTQVTEEIHCFLIVCKLTEISIKMIKALLSKVFKHRLLKGTRMVS